MSSGPKFVLRVRVAPEGYRHDQIVEVEYRHDFDEEPHYATVSVLALLIDEHGWDVRVAGADERVRVQTVHPYARTAYLRAFLDSAPTNDLIDLPRYS